MMQMAATIQLLGWILLILGIVIVLIALFSSNQRFKPEQLRKAESKGIILIGPIPIVWGYGRKVWLIAGIIGVLLVLFWLLQVA